MFCRNCGAEIKEGRKFCTECGAPVTPKENSVQPEIQKPENIKEPEPKKYAEEYIPPVVSSVQPEKAEKSSGIASVMNKVVNWFKGLSKKKKIIIIVIVVLLLFSAFGKNSDTGTTETESYTVPTSSEYSVEVTESVTEKESETEAQTKQPETTTEKETTKAPETTQKPETTKKIETAKKRTGIDPDFKAFWDGYEKYMDSYIKIMSSPDSFGTAEYLKILGEYVDWCDKADSYDDSECTDEEVKYMLEVQSRVTAKLTAAALG